MSWILNCDDKLITSSRVFVCVSLFKRIHDEEIYIEENYGGDLESLVGLLSMEINNDIKNGSLMGSS